MHKFCSAAVDEGLDIKSLAENDNIVNMLFVLLQYKNA